MLRGIGRLGLLLVFLTMAAGAGCFPGDRAGGGATRPPALLLSDFEQGIVARLDPFSRRLSGRPLRLPGGPSGMAAAAGRVYVAMLGKGYLVEIDPHAMEEVRRLPLGQPAVQVAASPDGGLLAASCFEAGQVVLLERESGRERERVTVGGHPFGLAWSPDGGRLYVTNDPRGTLQILEPGRGVVREVQVGLRPRGLALDHQRAAVALSGQDSLAVLSLPEDEVTVYPVGRGPYGVVLTGGGAVVSLSEEGALALVDFASGGVHRLEACEGVAGMALGPRGQFLYAACEGASQVFLLALHDNSPAGRIPLPRGASPREMVLVDFTRR